MVINLNGLRVWKIRPTLWFFVEKNMGKTTGDEKI